MMDAVDPFEDERPRLMAIAYRMLGSRAEAEDVVQEAWLRFSAAPREPIESVPGYLGTVVTRLCLDQLKSARARREQYVGPWLPEPVRTDEAPAKMALPETLIERESISTAFLVVLERLSPQERAVYLLHEVFDYSHAEAAEMVGVSEAAARQLFHRAKQHLLDGRPRFARSREEHQRLLGTFLDACLRGDLDGLCALLAEGARAISDGGDKAAAARHEIEGAEAVARFMIALTRKFAGGLTAELVELNGWPAVLMRDGAQVDSTLQLETDGERVYAVRMVRNPDKLAKL
jgi:RNA polymerase sigma-70 factor, ECF subfamily